MLALLLAGLYLIPTVTAPPPIERVVLIPLRPSEIASVEVGTDRLSYSTQVGGWVVELSDSETVWPATENTVRGGLRLLAQASGELLEGESGPALAPELSVRVVARDGRSWTLEFVTPPLGGLAQLVVTPASGEPVRAQTDAALFDALTGGLGGWLSPLAAPGPELRTGTLAMTNGTEALAFQRARRRWSVIVPIVTPADTERVDRLMATIRGVRLAGVGPVRGLSNPDALASVEIITSLGVEGATRTVLDVVGQSTLTPDAVRVRSRIEQLDPTGEVRSTLGPIEGEAPADALAALGLDAVEYLPRRSIDAQAVPIATVELRQPPPFDAAGPRLTADNLEPVYIRVGGAWTAQRGSAEAAAPLVAMLTELEADRMSIAPPEGFESKLLVRLGDDAGRPIGIAVVGVATVEDVRIATVQSGPVFRGYSGPAAETVLRLLDALGG